MNWYYAKNGAQEGPISTEALRAKIDSGEVAPSDLAWREGLPDWMPVSRIPDFSPQPAATTPTAPGPLPTATPASPYIPPAAAAPANPYAIQLPPSSGLAIGSMVCGILGLLGCCIWYVSIPLLIVAIVLGHVAKAKVKSDPARYAGKGMATTGLVTGYIGLILMILLSIFFFWVMSMPQEKRENLDFLPFLSEQQKQEIRDKMKEAEQNQQQRLESTSQP